MFEVHPLVVELSRLFEANGYELALAGGSVRDLFLKRASPDLDFTTSAGPDEIFELCKDWFDNIWDIGKDFGTIGGRKMYGSSYVQLEITTYRTDEYDSSSRKPLVKFGKVLEGDLSRRDFTINAMALRLPGLELVDPFSGLTDLNKGMLRTPIEPAKSFDDDPLRMLRAVRFHSTLNFTIEIETAAAITLMKERLSIISAERIRDELTKIITGPNPALGINALVDSGLNDYVLPELEDLKMQVDASHHHKDVYEHSLKVLENSIEYENKFKEVDDDTSPDLILRLAALLHDIGKPKTRRFTNRGTVTFYGHDVVGSAIAKKRLRKLHYDKKVVETVGKLIELHMRFYGYLDSGWTDSAVRRFANDAGDALNRLLIITRSDVTTKNKRKSNILSTACDDLECRIRKLQKQEELEAIRPGLNGFEIMETLGLSSGPQDGPKTGKAYKFLLNYRLEHGVVEKDKLISILREWAKENL
ncbi:MAG: CCA tRNA nucleotidyltransferase [Candidatus Ancillula trichonymphae]|jgi:poly(A) polymerase|nr:CCA tRNA nucleotidyltransferase [Candidatus Ancillula trichonymphae]